MHVVRAHELLAVEGDGYPAVAGVGSVMLQLDEETGLDKQGDQLIDPGCVVVSPLSVHVASPPYQASLGLPSLPAWSLLLTSSATLVHVRFGSCEANGAKFKSEGTPRQTRSGDYEPARVLPF